MFFPTYKRFMLLLGIVILASRPTASAEESSGIPYDLVVERIVARAVAAAGASTEVEAIEIPDLPQGSDARSFADFLLARVRGADTLAQQVALEALRRQQTEDRKNVWLGSMLSLLPTEDIAPDLRLEVARGVSPLHQAAHAAFLAREGQCRRASEVASGLASKSSLDPSTAVLVAGAYVGCRLYAEALQMLEPLRSNPDLLRVRLLAGESLLALGDFASASRWCGEVAEKSAGLPTLIHPAKRCVAAADALRGIMPRGRLEYIEACRDEMEDPAVMRTRRVDAGLAAVWVTLSGRVPGAPRRILDLLTRLERIDISSSSRTAGEMLALLSQAGLDIVPPKSRIAAATQISAAESPVPTLAWMVESLRAALSADDPGASVAMARAEEAARSFEAFELLAAVHYERARMARRDGNDSLARIHVRKALENWLKSEFPFSRTPFFDPGLPRALLETAVEIGLQGADFSGATAGDILPQIEYEKRLISDGRVEAGSIPGLAEIRQQLASVDGTLIYYVIGETKTFAWRVEPTGSHGRVLPAGDVLFDAVGEGGIAEEVLGTLVGSLAKDRILVISPDGFLGGLSWRDLETPNILSALSGALSTETQITIVPSLRKFINVSIGQVTPKGTAKVLVMAERRPPFSDDPGETWFDRFGLSRSPDFSFLEFSAENKSRVQGAAHRDHAVLHLRAPLLASGRGDAGFVVGLYGRLAASQGRRGLGRGNLAREGAHVRGHLDLNELLGSSIGGALIVLDVSSGWATNPESLAAAAARLVDHGAFAAVVPLTPWPEDVRETFWKKFYAGLNQGDVVLEALASSVDGMRSDLGGSPSTSIGYTGSVDLRLAEDRRMVLAFWIPFGLGAAILVVTLLLALRKKKDPFDIEPPEEI